MPLCWPLLAWLVALGTPLPPGAGRWLPGARPRPQAALEVEAAGPSLLAPLTPSLSATGSLPSQAQYPRRERPGQRAPRVAGILDRVWGIFPLGAGPTETGSWDAGRPRPSAEPGRPAPHSNGASPPGAWASGGHPLMPPFLSPCPRRHPAVSLAVAQHV